MEFNNSERVKKVTKGKSEEPKITEVIKAMTPEELEAFKRERYKKFIKPFLDQDDMRMIKRNKT